MSKYALTVQSEGQVDFVVSDIRTRQKAETIAQEAVKLVNKALEKLGDSYTPREYSIFETPYFLVAGDDLAPEEQVSICVDHLVDQRSGTQFAKSSERPHVREDSGPLSLSEEK